MQATKKKCKSSQNSIVKGQKSFCVSHIRSEALTICESKNRLNFPLLNPTSKDHSATITAIHAFKYDVLSVSPLSLPVCVHARL